MATDLNLLVPVAGALGGTVLGGLIGLASSLLVADRTDQVARRNQRISRLEELYDCIGRVRRLMSQAYAQGLFWIAQGKPYEKGESPPHERVDTLIRIYAPELEKEYDRIKAAAKPQNEILATALGSPPPKDAAGIAQATEKLRAASASLDAEYTNLARSVAEAARRLVNPGG